MSKARELADLGSVTTRLDEVGNTDGALSNRNLIINGAMQVAQRGTSFTGVTATQYCLDRFRWSLSSLGTWTISQSSDAPDGFGSSMKIDCTTADASPSSTDTLFIYHAIEGQDLQSLKKGSSDAQSLTLSFWVKSSKTGSAQVNIRDVDNTRVIGASYTVSSANTWEHKVVTFAGDTAGTLDNDNAKSLQLEWWLDAGSSYTAGSVPTSWGALSNADLCVSNFALGDSTSNYLQITGVQLEVGDTATPFEHRSYGDELQKCQRYYQVNGGIDEENEGVGAAYSTAALRGQRQTFPVTMRATPSVTISNGEYYNGAWVTDATVISSDISPDGFCTNYSKTSAFVTRGSYPIQYGYSADAEI